ncbi:MAG: SH3 domain-containing protein [Clostridia bacterium]|nr:SH3 domain-containing protein [Clostridia bacterium]MBQ6120579.1 SH3 domain-containing protein [Clostridia bacterium]
MSSNTGYSQYLRKYRVMVTARIKKTTTKVVKTVQTTPAVPAKPSTTIWTAKAKKKLAMRAGPGSKYKSYGSLKKGAAIELLTKSGKWYQAKNAKGKDGIVYVYSKYVKVTGTKTIAATAAQAAVESVVTETVDTWGNALDVSDLRCVFLCEKSLNDTPNYSQITIYNMNQQTISSIKAGDRVVLEAGYEGGNYGMIFTGDIVQPMVHRESSTDIALTLIVQDGDVYLNSAFTAKTLSKASTQGDVITACMTEDVARGAITGDLPKTKMVRGKVLFGKSAKYLRKVAANSNGQFYIEDGKVNIVAAKDYSSSQAVELNPMTGLIGMPEQTDDGVKGQCLINPSIKLNTLIYINSKLVTPKQVAEGETKYTAVNADGVYRIVKLTVEGDTHGDSWYMTFEAITQSGKKPAGMSSGETNPWR